jgi:serine/threonine protein kinase
VAALHPEQVVGCYKLIRLLGEGGMGEVWQALDMPADRLVALKFIRPELLNNRQVRTRFANEAKTLGKLEQDRIVPLYAVVEEGDMLAFALRYIDGQSLADRIDAQGPQSEKFALIFSRDILGALGYAHEHDVIHRDIKPQNILVTKQDQCFLTDFGIAVAAFLERATLGPIAIGTPHYMSPEQILRPSEVTIPNRGQRSDIYSFGVVLFELLTGQVPFGQDTNPDEIYVVQQAHCQQQPPAPRTVHDAVSPAMEDIVLWCLEKDPDRRPQTCAELLTEIERAISQPASQPSASRRVGTATIVESFTPAQSFTLPQQIQQAPLPQPKTRRNLIIASSVLAAATTVGITALVINRNPQKPDQNTLTNTDGGTKPVPDPNTNGTGSGSSGTSGTGTGTHTKGGNDSGAGNSNNTGGAHGTKTVVTTTPPPVPPPQPSHPPQGAALASKAAGEYEQGNYCDALGLLDQAIAIDPSYSSRRPGYKNACDHSRTD